MKPIASSFILHVKHLEKSPMYILKTPSIHEHFQLEGPYTLKGAGGGSIYEYLRSIVTKR
jgi:hypothetical protein